MRIARSAIGIIAGFLLFLAAIHWMPSWDLLPTLGCTVAAALVCGFFTALIAGAHELPHASALGLLMIGLSFLSMRQQGLTQPGWYQITIAGCGPVSAMLGAAMRLLTKQA